MPYTSENYLDLFDIETENIEERIESIRCKDILRYRVKTIRSGPMLECEIYPIWKTQKAASRAKKAKESRKAQQNLNDKNTKKRIVRLTNNNFTKHDIWATLTYDDKHLPSDDERVKKDVTNYIARVKRRRKKEGLPPIRYLYVIEFNRQGKKGDNIRPHIHIIMSGDMDRDVVEGLWKGGGRREAHRLQPDEFGLTGLAMYISKAPKGKKRWGYSQNLKEPKITVADRKITKRKVEKIAENENTAPEVFEKLYKGYVYTDIDIRCSDFVSGAYIYVGMRLDENS